MRKPAMLPFDLQASLAVLLGRSVFHRAIVLHVLQAGRAATGQVGWQTGELGLAVTRAGEC
jgi:hypothetical protein